MRKQAFAHLGFTDDDASARDDADAADAVASPDEIDDVSDEDDTVQSTIALYLKDAARYPRLTAAEECELSRRIREEHDPAAETVFIQSNLRLVISVAKEYQAQGLSLLDLIQEGNIGLMKAITRYDGRKGFRFSTYGVWWIRQQITRAIWSSHGPMKIPTRIIDEHRRVVREQRRAEEEAAPDAPVAGPSAPAEPSPWSIVAISPEETEQYLETLPASEAESPDYLAENRDLLHGILKALEPVSQRDQQIIVELFGLDDTTPIKLEQVARRHSLTCERVRQIKKAAFECIRRSPYAQQLAVSY